MTLFNLWKAPREESWSVHHLNNAGEKCRCLNTITPTIINGQFNENKVNHLPDHSCVSLRVRPVDGARALTSVQVPEFQIAVQRPTDYLIGIKLQAGDCILVTLQCAETGARLQAPDLWKW